MIGGEEDNFGSFFAETMPLLSRKRVTTATQSVDRFSTQHLSTNQISSPIAISQPLPLPPATASESNPQIENSCITKLDSTIIVKSKTPLKFSNKANIIETIGVNVAKMVSKRSNSADSPKEAKKRKNGENRITNGDTRETPTTEIEQTDLRLSTQDLEALSRLDSSMEVEPNGQMIEEEGQFNLDSPITESQFFANDSRSQFTRMYQCNAEAEMEKAKDVNGEIGHIQEITLQNFMCHSHFHLELGPRINFILGPNGSKFQYLFLFSMLFLNFPRWQVGHSQWNRFGPRRKSFEHQSCLGTGLFYQDW